MCGPWGILFSQSSVTRLRLYLLKLHGYRVMNRNYFSLRPRSHQGQSLNLRSRSVWSERSGMWWNSMGRHGMYWTGQPFLICGKI